MHRYAVPMSERAKRNVFWFLPRNNELHVCCLY